MIELALRKKSCPPKLSLQGRPQRSWAYAPDVVSLRKPLPLDSSQGRGLDYVETCARSCRNCGKAIIQMDLETVERPYTGSIAAPFTAYW